MDARGGLKSFSPSEINTWALEDSAIWEFDFSAFEELANTYMDIAKFHMRYMWREIIRNSRQEKMDDLDKTAHLAYLKFQKDYPHLESRLTSEEIAAYLGILPKHLRILRERNN